MGYIRDHWRGHHALPRAFWINFLIPFVLIAMAEPWIRPAAAGSSIAATGGSVVQGVLALLYILATHAVILPWQLVGLWRSSRRHLAERGDLGVVTFAQGAALVALVTAVGATTTTVQHVFGFGQGASDSTTAPPGYTLTVRSDAKTVAIDGRFDTGLSRDLKVLLAETPGIDGIVLNSDGGRVFEARGVANQIVERNLDTHVDHHCRSACTIAFIAGRKRTLGEGGGLGFHSYRLDATIGFVDPKDEQQKDQAFFLGQGVLPAFVAHAFKTPHEDMWHPSVGELLRADVIHQIVKNR